MTVTGFDPAEDGASFLDADHAYKFYFSTESGTRPAGLIESHRLPDGNWCEGAVAFKGRGGGSPQWTVLLEDPLTLSPSILCRDCGSHGYIEGGKWRPA